MKKKVKKNIIVKCNCGSIFRKKDKETHFRSVIHENYIFLNPDEEINLEIVEIIEYN